MAKVIAIGPTDTVVAGHAQNDVVAPALNFEADFRVISEVPGEVILTNVTCPIDQPETLRFAQRKVANVYSGTDIDPSAYLPSRQGTSTVVQLRQVAAETSTTDEAYRKSLPMSCGITFTVPSYVAVTPAMVLDLVERTVSALFEQAVDSDSGIDALLHGVMKKSVL